MICQSHFLVFTWKILKYVCWRDVCISLKHQSHVPREWHQRKVPWTGGARWEGNSVMCGVGEHHFEINQAQKGKYHVSDYVDSKRIEVVEAENKRWMCVGGLRPKGTKSQEHPGFSFWHLLHSTTVSRTWQKHLRNKYQMSSFLLSLI